MKVVKMIVAILLFLAMTYVSFKVGFIFGIMFLLSGVYSFYFYDSWERPGIPVLWFMGALICRVAFLDMLLPIFRYEAIIDLVIGLFAFGVVYLLGYIVKNN